VKLAESRGDDHRRVRRCRLGGAAGTAVVEFALVVPLLLLIVFGIIDFGRALNYWNDATHLASTGARFAIVNQNPGDPGTLADWIKSKGDTGEFQDNATVCIAFLGEPQVGQAVEVTVDVEFTWLPFIGGEALGGITSTTMTGSAVMRLEQPPTTPGITGCSS
jgi:hypothetical protein